MSGTPSVSCPLPTLPEASPTHSSWHSDALGLPGALPKHSELPGSANASRAALNQSMSDGRGVEGNGYACISALEGTKLRCDLHRLRSLALGLCSHLGHSLTSALPFQSQSSHLTCFFSWDCPNKSPSPRSSSQRLLLGNQRRHLLLLVRLMRLQ